MEQSNKQNCLCNATVPQLIDPRLGTIACNNCDVDDGRHHLQTRLAPAPAVS